MEFQEITEAYDFLLKHPAYGSGRDPSVDDQLAREILRRERERMQQRARAQREKKRQQDEYFNKPEWHDFILLLKYAGNGILLLIGLSAITGPILIALLGDPASLAGTSIFMIMGINLLAYIYKQRRTWFRL